MRLKGLGCGVLGSKSVIPVLGFKVQGLGCGVLGLKSVILALGFKVQGLGCGVLGLKSMIPAPGFKVQGLGLSTEWDRRHGHGPGDDAEPTHNLHEKRALLSLSQP